MQSPKTKDVSLCSTHRMRSTFTLFLFVFGLCLFEFVELDFLSVLLHFMKTIVALSVFTLTFPSFLSQAILNRNVRSFPFKEVTAGLIFLLCVSFIGFLGTTADCYCFHNAGYWQAGTTVDCERFGRLESLACTALS